jgi:cholestenol delta-isomerase
MQYLFSVSLRILLFNMANHPYYPTTLNIPNYVPNERSPLQISMISNGSMLVMVIISIFLAKWSKTTTSIPRFAWFVVGGLLHVLFEGYWLLNKDIIPGHNGVLAELWKEYAHGDSRYMVADELLLTLEIISVASIRREKKKRCFH